MIPILILAYYGAYLFVRKWEKAPGWSKAGLIVSSLFLLYVAFMLVNNNTLALRPDRWELYAARSGGWNLNLGEPTLWPRYLHFLIAALAIGALGRAIFYRFSAMEEEEKEIQIRRNLKIFGWMTLVQLAIGTWFWLTMPGPVWRSFMGGSMFATVMMVVGWLSALLILHSAFTGRLNLAMILGALQVLVMVIIRDLARAAYLREVFRPTELENVGEVSPLIAFLLVFLIGLGALYYMIRLIFKSKTHAS